MQAVKNAAATTKEKIGNVNAKVEEKYDKAKASTDEKVLALLQYSMFPNPIRRLMREITSPATVVQSI
jgi:hypothetical protein